jgi:hypothetical protein
MQPVHAVGTLPQRHTLPTQHVRLIIGAHATERRSSEVV